jgi:hypothetical protein
MRQQGIGFAGYANEFKDYIPPVGQAYDTLGQTRGAYCLCPPWRWP